MRAVGIRLKCLLVRHVFKGIVEDMVYGVQYINKPFVLLKLTICKPVCKYSGIVKSEYIDMCFVYEIVCHDGNVSVPEPWPCHTHVRRVESQ